MKSLLAALLCASIPACSRHWHRTKADEETYQAIAEKGGFIDRASIYPRADSRLHDPNAIDCPPMPPDDPTSHQLMKCVDGKAGYPEWEKNGRLASVEPVGWHASLPTDEEGRITLDLQSAIRVARTHSREYQDNLETLYLSALDVTFERFRFDHQFFAGTRIDQEFRGRNDGGFSQTSITPGAGFSKLSATGGQLAVDFANALVWDAWGSGGDAFSSTLDFSLVQPLLRLGGRARVLENLTQTERNLLANVRQMQQFRQGFYVNVATGRNSGSGPSGGNGVGQNGLGLIAGFPSGRNGAPSAGGYLGLLQTQQQIRNQTTNIVALRDSLAQLEANFDSNRISNRLQVDQARQALLNAQSSLLSSKAAYDSRVDAFKIDLGLPPDLPIEIKDKLLDRFALIDPDLTALQDDLTAVLASIRKKQETSNPKFVATALDELAALEEDCLVQLAAAKADLETFTQNLPERKKKLKDVADQIAELEADVDDRVYDEEKLLERVAFIERRVPQIGKTMKVNFLSRTQMAKHLDDPTKWIKKESLDDDSDEDTTENEDTSQNKKKVSPEKKQWNELHRLATDLSDMLLELSLVRAEMRLQGIALLPMQIEPHEAIDAARLNRLDWMNARANLVDNWRRIEFFANDLKSDLDIEVVGRLGTGSNDLFSFDPDNSRIRMGLRFDSPITRLSERNRYREALIQYQQARRDYMLFEDRITQSLRNTIRIIKLSRINLEVRRTAVQVAIAQVDNARIRLNPPAPSANQRSRSSPTAARDLLSALTDLLDAQNDLLNVWVSYEVLRVLLDFEMGTMELNPNGVWIDPGPVEKANSPGLPKGEGLGDDLFIHQFSS